MEELSPDVAVREIWYSTLNLLKESLESEGIDFGETKNEIDWYKHHLRTIKAEAENTEEIIEEPEE